MKLVFLILVVGIVGSFAIPFQRRSRNVVHEEQRTKCASSCTGVSNKFRYHEGKSYDYKYEAESKVRLAGTSNEETTVRQTATVTISALGSCEFSLKISDVNIEGPQSSELKPELERRPLRFSFDDGLIREICPEPSEPAWVLNIKRAILSSFQNALEGSAPRTEVMETDVSGRCPTKYETKNGKIVKSKELTSCQGYHGNYTSLRGINYDVKSRVQNFPLMDSNQECEHTMDRHMLKEAVCTESHSLRPFRSGDDNGVKSQTVTKLHFLNEKTETIDSVVGERKSLHFDHSEYQFEESSEANALARHNIHELCRISSQEVRPETPALFTELVYNMRKMSENDLRQLHQESQAMSICKREREFFLDAVPMCGTENCVKLMVHVLRAGTLSKTEANTWFTSMSLVPKPTRAMVETVLQLVDTTPNHALLGISSLVHGYCKQNPYCAEIPEVEQFIQKLNDNLGEKCEARDDANIEKMILTLKAIGNVGHVQSVVQKLVACFSNEQNQMEIRLSAMQALHRMPCGEQTQPLMEVFRDRQEQVELRLVAFVTALKCPTKDLVREMQTLLDEEPINQVSSFVWSYLKEKKESSDPATQELARLLQTVKLSSRFDRDPRRYSRYYEFGTLMNSLNMGGHVEGAWILSPESYMPRQGYMNLTVHLFGTSINLLEVGGRAEGVDRLLEKLIGPDGYFTNPSGYFMREKSKPHSNTRIRSFQDLYTQRRPANEELALSLYMKIFGDELAYYKFKDERVIESFNKLMDVERLMENLETMKEVELSKNILFMDTTITIPTISGMPLRLSVNGTASMKMQFASKMNLRQVMRKPHNMDLEASVSPSAAIEVSAMMAMQSGKVKSGIRLVTRLHTSTSMKGLVELRNGETFKTKFELPKDKMEIIDVQSQIFILSHDVHTEMAGIQENKFVGQACTPEKLSRWIGVRLCGEMRYPNASLVQKAPFFPLTGPVRTTITLEKADPSLLSYEFMTEFKNEQEKKLAKFSFNTPGSTVDREIRAEVMYESGRAIMAELRVPNKEIKAEGTLEKTGKTSTGRLALTVDQKEQYEVTATIEEEEGLYKVDSSIKVPNREAVALKGSVQTFTPANKRAAIEYRVENLYSEPVVGKFAFDMATTPYQKINAEAMMRCPGIHFDAVYAGGADADGSYNYKLAGEYKRPRDATPHKFELSQKQTIEKSGSKYQLTSISKFESSWYPNYNGEAEYKLVKDDSMIENRFGALWLGGKRADLHQVTRMDAEGRYITELNAVVPDLQVNHQAKIVYLNRYPERFLTEIELDTPRVKDIKATVSLENRNSGKWNMEAEATLEYPGRKMRAYKTVEEVNPKEYKSQAIVQWQEGHQIEMNTDLKLKSEHGKYEYVIDSEAKMTGKPESLKMHKMFKLTASEAKYAGYLRRGEESLYDFKLDTVKANEKKTDFHSHFKSNYMNDMDYVVAGSVEAHQRTTKVEFVLKKQQQDWMKGDFVVPTRFLAHENERQVKGHLTWDMTQQTPKELLLNYEMTTPSEHNRIHDIVARVRINHLHYKLETKVAKQSHQYSTNITLAKDDSPLIKFNVGLLKHGHWIHPSDLAFDMEFETKEPFGKHHYSSLFTHKCDETTGKTAGHLTCHSTGNKLHFEVSQSEKFIGKSNRMEKEYSVLIGANDNELKIEEKQEMIGQSILEGGLQKLQTKGHLSWEGAKKKITFESDIDLSWPLIIKNKFTTPFKRITDGRFEIELSGNDLDRRYKTEIGWNKNKRITAELSGQMQPMTTDVTAILETSFETLKKLESKVKYDFRQSWDLDSSLEWNNGNKARIFHKKTVEGENRKVELGFETKVKSKMDWEGNMLATWNMNSYEAVARLRLDESNWKVEGNANTQAKTGEFKVETPYETLRNARIQIKKVGENEYVFETEKNGEEQLTVTSMMKLEEGNHEIKFEVDKVRYPFALHYQGEFTDMKWALKAEIVREPNKPEAKTYGLVLSDEAKDEFTREMNIRIKNPKREVVVMGKRSNMWPEKYQILAEIQLDHASNRVPTRFELTAMKRPEMTFAEIHLNDPSLPKGVKAIGKLIENGDCESETSTKCGRSVEMTLDYSGDVEKTLVVKGKMDRETLSIARLVKMDTVHVKSTKNQFEFEMNHPATDLHTKVWLSHVSDDCGSPIACRYYTESGVEYKNRQKEVKQYATTFEADSYVSKLSLKVLTPTDKWTVQAQPGIHPGELKMTFFEDEEPVYEGVFTPNTDERTVLFEVRRMRGSGEVLLHASARLLNKDLAQVLVWHTETGRRVDDGEITVKLDRSNLLRTKFYIRPGMDRELQYIAGQGVQEVSNVDSTNSWREVYDAVYDSHKRFADDIWTHTQPMFTHWQSQRQSLVEDLGPLYQELKDNVEYYWELVREFFLASLDVVQMSLNEIINTVPSKTFRDAYQSMKKRLSNVGRYISELLEPLRRSVESFGTMMQRFTEKASKTTKWIREKTSWKEISKAVNNALKEFDDSYIVRKLKEWFNAAKDQVADWHLDDMGDKIKDYYQNAGRQMNAVSEKMSKWWENWRESLMEYELGRALVEVLQEMYSKVKWSYEYVDPEDKIESTFRWIRGQIQKYNPGTAEGWSEYFPRMTVNNPEDGHYEMEIPLYTHVNSLEHLGRIVHPDTWEGVKNQMTEKFDEYSNQLSNSLNYATSSDDSDSDLLESDSGFQVESWEPKDLVPPFKSTAILIGNQHFITFDGKVFDFKAGCRYLLARDFHDGRFSISADYVRHGSEVLLNSLTVETNGHEIEMNRRGHVKIDGQEHELPWQKMDHLEGTVLVKVSRRDHSAHLKTQDQLSVKCDWYYHMCTIKLPGHYHGKSSGLLGTNDNEPSNDFMLSSGSMTDNVEEFARSWHVGDATCDQEKNVAELERIPETHEKYPLCANFFQSRSSKFSSCFRSVNPEPFMRMCEVDMHRAGEYHQEVACNISAAYMAACRFRGINLDQSSECIRCSTPKSSLNEGENTRVESSEAPKAADVVFVVEEQPCMSFAKDKIAEFGMKIETELGKKHFRDVRFGLIAFNGEGVHSKPHHHTGDNQLNFDHRALQKAAHNLEFQQQSMVKQTPVDPMEALEFAVDRYAYRAGVKKVLVLLTCSVCEGKSVGYYELQNKLLNSGIDFHMITSNEIELREGESQQFIGFDATAMFSEHGQHHDSERSALLEPHDSCTILAQETTGTVFHASETKIAKVVDVMSHKIALKVDEPSCQVCECQLASSYANTPRTFCYPCDIPQPVSLTSGGNSFFNIPYLKLKPSKPEAFF